MAKKKYASLSTLQTFLDNLKSTFAPIVHTHTINDISDFSIDSELSAESTNPVQNKIVNAEFDAISEGMGALESAIDDKADKTELIQSDWHQNDATSLDYIKNRDVYKSLVLDETLHSDLITDLAHGVTLMKDLSSYDVYMLKYYTYDSNMDRKSYYFLEFTCDVVGANGYSAVVKTTTAYSKIDDANWRVKGNNYWYFYVITDLTTLSEENKALFPALGIYLWCDASYTKTDMFKNFRAKMWSYTKLDERLLPITAVTQKDLVQSDWNQTDDTALDYIKNKPEIATDDEIIEMLMQEDMFPVVTDSDGSMLADENGDILLW